MISMKPMWSINESSPSTVANILINSLINYFDIEILKTKYQRY